MDILSRTDFGSFLSAEDINDFLRKDSRTGASYRTPTQRNVPLSRTSFGGDMFDSAQMISFMNREDKVIDIGTSPGTNKKDMVNTSFRIDDYLDTGNLSTLINPTGLTSRYRQGPLFQEYVEHLSKICNTRKGRPSSSDLFHSIFFNTYGIDSTNLCSVLHNYAKQNLTEGGRLSKVCREEKDENKHNLQKMLMSKNVKSQIPKDDVEKLTEHLHNGHLKAEKVKNVTDEMLSLMWMETKEAMMPKVLNTLKVLHEIMTFMVEPSMSRQMFMEGITEVVTIDNNMYADAVIQIEEAMRGRPLSIEGDIGRISDLTHMMTLPTLYRLNNSDSSPLVDVLMNTVLGVEFSEILYLHVLNRMEHFNSIASSTDILQKVKDIEKTIPKEDSLRENSNPTMKLQYLWCKMTMFITWLTVYNNLEPWRNVSLSSADVVNSSHTSNPNNEQIFKSHRQWSANCSNHTLAVGCMDDFGNRGGEKVFEIQEAGKDVIIMNPNTLYFSHGFYYIRDCGHVTKAYKSKCYKMLAARHIVASKE